MFNQPFFTLNVITDTTSIAPKINTNPIISGSTNFVLKHSHVRTALVTGSTVTNRLAFTLPSILIPIPYRTNGKREPIIATATDNKIMSVDTSGKRYVPVVTVNNMDDKTEPHPITLISPNSSYNFCGYRQYIVKHTAELSPQISDSFDTAKELSCQCVAIRKIPQNAHKTATVSYDFGLLCNTIAV